MDKRLMKKRMLNSSLEEIYSSFVKVTNFFEWFTYNFKKYPHERTKKALLKKDVCIYLPNPLHGQDVTQGQLLSGV